MVYSLYLMIVPVGSGGKSEVERGRLDKLILYVMMDVMILLTGKIDSVKGGDAVLETRKGKELFKLTYGSEEYTLSPE